MPGLPFKQIPAKKMFKLFTSSDKGVFAFIKNLHYDKNSAFSKYMKDEIFMIPTSGMLEKIVSAIDRLHMSGTDEKGDLTQR